MEGAVAQPKVSIITIFYQAAQFLPEALASIAGQDFADWELLLVDDGSTDEGTRIAREFAAADARVRLLEHPGRVNRGTSASRNLGFEQSRGDYVIRLDADDVFMSPQALSEQVALLDAHPGVGLVFGPCQYWNSWRGGEDRIHPLTFADQEVAPPTLLALMLFPGHDEPISMMARRSAIVAAGGCDESIRDYGEDFVLSVKLTAANRIWVSSRCWYRYRMHPASYTHGIRAVGGQEAMELALMRWLAPWLRSAGIRDRAVWRAYRRRAWPPRIAPLRRWWDHLRNDLSWAMLRARTGLRNRIGSRKGAASLVTDPQWSEGPHPAAMFLVDVRWTCPADQRVQVRVNAPGGMMFADGVLGSDARKTGTWVGDRMRFFLQDADAPNPAAPEATLAVARARMRVVTPSRAGR
jgi:glycosyltransferase involved in cell wall biosynthesis